MQVKIKKLKEDATIPTRGSDKAAGYDLYAYAKDEPFAVIIQPHETKLIGTGLSITPPDGYFGAIFARSGERIAQLVFLPYVGADFVEVDKLEETDRGAGGFGSTGK